MANVIPHEKKLQIPSPEKVTREAGREASIGDIPIADLEKLLCMYSNHGRCFQKVGLLSAT